MAATYPVVQQDNEWSLHVDFRAVPLTSEQFYRLCMDNPELRKELTAHGELALIAKSSKHENAKQPHWAQARSSCWGTRSPPL